MLKANQKDFVVVGDAPCGSRYPADKVFCQQDPRGQNIYWIWPPGDKFDAGPNTDFAAVEQGYVAIMPLQVDITAYTTQEGKS